MSFILDALKRAERERKLDQAPDLSAVYQEEYKGARKHRSWVWISGAVLAAVMAVGYVFWPIAPFRKNTKIEPPETVSTAKVPKTPPKQVAKPAAATVVIKAKTEAAPPPIKRTKPSTPQSEAPSNSRDKLKGQTHVLEPPSLPESAARQQTKPNDMLAETETVPEKPSKVPGEPLDEKRLKEMQASLEPPSESTPQRPSQEKPLSLKELPAEIREALDPLTINVHMYDKNPKERRVFINMRGYREGGKIEESEFRLIQITPDGVIIDYGQGTVFLPVKKK